jgi:two-component system LytT family sensor kinase
MRLKIITTHLLVWLAYMFYEFFVAYYAGIPIRPLNMMVSFIFNAAVFYGAWLSFNWIRREVKNKDVIIILYLLTGAGILAVTIFLKLVTQSLMDQKPLMELATRMHIVTLLMRSVYFAVMGVGYSFAELSKFRQKEVYQHQLDNVRLVQEQDRLQKNAIQSDLDLIKAQINPHFLFNTLGFLYSETYIKLPKVGQSILMLSDIMRHALSGTKNGFSTLDSELSYINDYINIHKERNDHIFLAYTPQDYPDTIEIVSMVLITLIENIFKHGLLNRPDKEAILKIELIGDKLSYYSFNYKNANRKMESNRIGMAYIKQRLEHEYGENFELLVNNDDTSYECKLTFPVKF